LRDSCYFKGQKYLIGYNTNEVKLNRNIVRELASPKKQTTTFNFPNEESLLNISKNVISGGVSRSSMKIMNVSPHRGSEVKKEIQPRSFLRRNTG
jgi:hypothetical protein